MFVSVFSLGVSEGCLKGPDGLSCVREGKEGVYDSYLSRIHKVVAGWSWELG